MKDIYSDKNFKILHKIMQNNLEFKGILKNAEESLSIDSDNLPSTAFADSDNLRFPINTPEMAKLSYFYAIYQKAPSDVLEKISEALELYGEVNPKVNIGSNPINSSVYIFSDELRYPVNNSSEVKIAAAYFEDYGHQFSIEERKRFCEGLVKIADSYHIHPSDFSEHIRRYAGITGTDLSKLALDIDERLNICRTSNKPSYYKNAYETLLKTALEYKGSLHTSTVYDRPREFEKIALTLKEIDLDAGLDNYYSIAINDPYTAVFNTEKLAEGTIFIDAEAIPYSWFNRLDKEDYKEILGPEVIDEIYNPDGHLNHEALKTILKTLPLDLKRELVKTLRYS